MLESAPEYGTTVATINFLFCICFEDYLRGLHLKMIRNVEMITK